MEYKVARFGIRSSLCDVHRDSEYVSCATSRFIVLQVLTENTVRLHPLGFIVYICQLREPFYTDTCYLDTQGM